MSLIDDYLPYTDQYGLIQPNSETSGNGLLYSAEAIVAWYDNGALIDPSVRSMWANVYRRCEKSPGLMERSPGRFSDDQEGPDDYIGCGLASAFIDEGNLARRILYHGEVNKCKKWDSKYEEPQKMKLSKWTYRILRLFYWTGIPYIYNDNNPGYFTLSSWMGRFPQLQAHLKHATQEKPTFLQRLFWAGSLALNAYKNDPNDRDAWCLSWCLVRCWEKRYRKGFLARLGVRYWRKAFAKTWGNPGALIAAYHQNPDHPNAIWLKKSN